MADLKLTKKDREELAALGINTPTDGSDPGDPNGGVVQTPGNQHVISTQDDGWRKAYLKALHS